MKSFRDFFGSFGDFETMFHDTSFNDWRIRIYDENGDAMYKQIVGYTMLPNDIMVQMVDIQGCEDVDDLVGIELRLFSDIIKNGIDIFDTDNDDNDDDDDSDEDTDDNSDWIDHDDEDEDLTLREAYKAYWGVYPDDGRDF